MELLIANQGKGGTWAAIPIPLVVRAPIGVLLVIWGAPRNQRWTVPVCAMLDASKTPELYTTFRTDIGQSSTAT